MLRGDAQCLRVARFQSEPTRASKVALILQCSQNMRLVRALFVTPEQSRRPA